MMLPELRPYPIVSADCHISAPHDIYRHLSPELQQFAPRFEERDGIVWYLSDGQPAYPSLPKSLAGVWSDDRTTEMMLQREHRLTWGRETETSGSQRKRLSEQLRDGVEAEVQYHNGAADLCASPNLQYQIETARLLNDWLAGWVRGYEHRMVSTAVLPLYLDQLDATIAELTRARELGFRSANLPVVVPWLPYESLVYDRLWSAFEDLDMIAAFHTFSGNAFIGTDFADVHNLPDAFLAAARRRRLSEPFKERLALTVMGMAAGISPVVHLCGSGVLQRHPKLRFVIVEAEMGWLGWVLQSMDAMAHKRKAHMRDLKLDLLPSQYFKRQGWITFTDDEYGLAQLDFVGADRVMWSNDYPHDEGTYLESKDTIDRLFAHVSAADQEKLLWSNASALYGLEAGPILAERPVLNDGQRKSDPHLLVDTTNP